MRSRALVLPLLVAASAACSIPRHASADGTRTSGEGPVTTRTQARCRPVVVGARAHRACRRTPRRAPTSVPDTTAVPDTAVAR